MINIYNSKEVAIIADPHFGIHQDGEMWHKIAIDYAKWLKIELVKKNITDIIILGDIFNNREEIGVKTLSVVEQFFNIFNDPITPFNIILLNGNHDSYLKDSSEINSISIFKGWKNITVVDKQTTVGVNGKTFTFLSWGEDLENLPSEGWTTDVLFGHMEINTFKKNIAKLCEDGFDSNTLLEKAKLVMSGHFHLREERKYPKGRIIYVGSTYPQSWSDAGAVNGYYILNVQDLTTQFYENTISPRYYKLKLSDFFDKAKLPVIRQLIPNNFIKLQIDKPITSDMYEKVINVLALLNPLEISSDFNENSEIAVNKDYESIHLDTKSLIGEFIESLDLKDLKAKVLKESEEIYAKALTKVNIENE